jgi:diguanylate cyclase (GGDEF)-like protein
MARDRGRALRWFATGVVVAGGLAVVATPVAGHARLPFLQAGQPISMIGLVALASAAGVRARTRSTVVGTTWTDAAILVCIVSLAPQWVPLCVAVGVVIAKLLSRVSPFKTAYNAAKDALSAAVGLHVALELGVAHQLDPLGHPLALALVALSVAATEYAIGVPVLALATGTPWRTLLAADADIKVASAVGKFAIALLALKLYEIEGGLLAIPPIALCLHMIYASRVRTRGERAAWRRLAATTEELNDTDLHVVLAAAVVNAASLYAADDAEVLLRDGPDGPLLVRGDADGAYWSGDPGRAPPHRHDGETITVRLAGHDLEADVGEVRLHYAGRVRLTDGERLSLPTFVSALQTAVHNAAALAEAQRLTNRITHAALHDPLTGLPNRRRLQEYGDRVLAESRAAALVVMDLDHVREVNEALGHVAGDRLLADVASRLTRAAGPNDLVARLGGHEFAVLLAGVGAATTAEQRARELLTTLDPAVDLGGMRVWVEASAGVAVANGGEQTDGAEGGSCGMVEMLRRANIAMYQAKRGGSRIVRYDPRRDTTDVAQLMLGGDLPRAVAMREFSVNFQPIVDLASGRMIAAEALARWHHPDRGDLDPRSFLAAVESSGLLPAFADAVLDQALAAMRRWRGAGIDVPVAVNASPRSLLDPKFPRMVADRLAGHDLRGGDLVVELTESLTPTQGELVGDVLRELRQVGVRLALDDFGTGSSSLAMLEKVQVDELKIDRSFVAAMRSSPEAAAVVRSTVELGRSLGLLVVAEGVENAHQRQVLWELGCPAAQGHLFAKPMPIDALLDTLRLGVDAVPGQLSEPMPTAAGGVVGPSGMRPGAVDSICASPRS